ncbi:MAG: cell surface protein, partial [Corynebacterium urealyticum]
MSKAIAGKKAAAFSAAFAIALSAGVVGADATVAQAQEGETSDVQPNSDGYSVTI